MKLKNTVKEFLEKNLELVDSNSFDELFSRARIYIDYGDIGNLSSALYEIGVNPLQYTNKVPAHFLHNGTYKDVVTMSHDNVSIENAAFLRSSIKGVIVPGSVKRIEQDAFHDCKNLKNVTLQEGVEVIGNSSFEACINIKTITFPNSVNYIAPRAFFNCRGLTDVKLPSSLKVVSSESFAYTGLTSVVVPEGVWKISDNAFDSSSNLRSVKLPSTIKEIGSSAFAWTAVEEVEIPEGTETVGRGCFAGCENLKKVTFPKSVTDLYRGMFNGIDTSKITIRCYHGSAAEEVAHDYKMKIEYLD